MKYENVLCFLKMCLVLYIDNLKVVCVSWKYFDAKYLHICTFKGCVSVTFVSKQCNSVKYLQRYIKKDLRKYEKLTEFHDG